MNEFQCFDYPPPRRWEQFEELCADLFEAMWNDPGLVRHGRAGQKQYGVDIVGRQGALYPVGLQCKKKAQWPVQRLSTDEIDREVNEAKSFTPALRAFYLLTTAEDDTKLQSHVRNLNQQHTTEGLFSIVLLGWSEIVRRVARHERVAKKHFPGFGAAEQLSPLLATWYTTKGKLEVTGEDWDLAVAEAAEDFFDWPGGHIVVRQRETDALVQKLLDLSGHAPSASFRKQRLALRVELRRSLLKERHVGATIRMIFSNEKLRMHFLDLWVEEGDLPRTIHALIENDLDPDLRSAHALKVRVHPPSSHLLLGYRAPNSVADRDISVDMPQDAYMAIHDIKQERIAKFGNAATDTVGELPPSVRSDYVVPAIIRRIMRILDEDKKTVHEMDQAGYLDLFQWKVTI